MPFNGSGTFSIVNTFVPNTTILSAAVNQNFTDIATGLSNVLTRDGQAGMTAALKLISGTIGAPSLSFNADAAAGIYQPAVGSVGIVTNSLGMKVNSVTFGAISATVTAGGSGYAVGDTIYLTGGTSSVVAAFTVATLSGSAVATVTMTVPGCYQTKPTNPVSQGSTSGAGTGCTLTVTYNDGTSVFHLNITNLSDALLWQALGASSFVSGIMGLANGLDFATGIGAANLANALSASFLITPQGYLTPTSGAPIIATDATGATSVFYTPYQGNIIPIYNGTHFVNTVFTELTCTLTAGSQVSGGIYDVYVFNNAGVLTIGFSPSWAAGSGGSVTAGSAARGTGAGGTALTRINGILVNTVSMTVNNSSSTFTIGVNQGTYVGSIYVNNTAGQVNCLRTISQNRAWGIWNAYNRAPIILGVTDSTASWTYTGPISIRAANNNTANTMATFCGLAEEEIYVDYSQLTAITITNGSATAANLIGINTTATSTSTGATAASTTTASLVEGRPQTHILILPTLGPLNITALERVDNNSGTFSVIYNGTSANMLLTAQWRG